MKLKIKENVPMSMLIILGISFVSSIMMACALSGVWWYEIVDFTLPDPNNEGETISIHIHGGLFKEWLLIGIFYLKMTEILF